jgi:hypothetical protein
MRFDQIKNIEQITIRLIPGKNTVNQTCNRLNPISGLIGNFCSRRKDELTMVE